MENFYRIAGLTVAMDSHGTTARQAEPYRCAPVAKPDIVVSRDIWKVYKERHPDASDDVAEYMMTGAWFYKYLLDFGGLRLHASAVVLNSRAYLFTAPSGTGKSTHTQLWLQEFPDAFILNDDKPALRREEDGWFAYGTPWSGKTDQSVNARIPLGGIALLERAHENRIVPACGPDTVRKLLSQVNRPKAAEYRIKMMELLDQLIREVPIWKLSCNTDPEAARIAFDIMGQK